MPTSDLPPDILLPLHQVKRRSQTEYPQYRFVPKRHPHPLKSNGDIRHIPIAEDASNQAQWDYAVDLFNAAYYWEAHEVWEGLWKKWKKTHHQNAQFTQGCIFVTAAALQNHLGRIDISQKMLQRAQTLLQVGYQDTDICFDCHFTKWCESHLTILNSPMLFQRRNLWRYCAIQRLNFIE